MFKQRLDFILFFGLVLLCVISAHAKRPRVKLCKLGEVFSVDGRNVGIFGESGGGAGGYLGLVQSQTGSFRAKYTYSGTITGLVAGNITHGYQDSRVHKKEGGVDPVYTQEDKYTTQWSDDQGNTYDVDLTGYTKFLESDLIAFFTQTSVFPDERIYWNPTGLFRTTNPALSYYNERNVVLKFTEETFDPQTSTINVTGKLYVIIDPVDTWDIEDAFPCEQCHDDNDDDGQNNYC